MPGNRPAERRDGCGDVVADGGVHLRIAHDAFLERVAAGFELRLDQRDELRARRGKRR